MLLQIMTKKDLAVTGFEAQKNPGFIPGIPAYLENTSNSQFLLVISLGFLRKNAELSKEFTNPQDLNGCELKKSCKPDHMEDKDVCALPSGPLVFKKSVKYLS